MDETIDLNDGTTLPRVGLGTWDLRGEAGTAAMTSALKTGYRLLDSASGYRNEQATGLAVRESDVPRDEIAVTTKLPNDAHGRDATLRSFDASADALGVGVVDVYLIHWPGSDPAQDAASWAAITELQAQGRIRSIGVSNFSREQIEALERETGVLPAVNQVELHLGLDQAELRAFHDERGIVTESYSPLKHSHAAAARRIAEAHGVGPHRVALRWNLQLNCIVIPKSKDPDRQANNLDLFGFELSDDEMRELSAVRA